MHEREGIQIMWDMSITLFKEVDKWFHIIQSVESGI